MKYLIPLFLIVFVSCGNAEAKVEVWECYYDDGEFEGLYKLDTDKPQLYTRFKGKWKKWTTEYYDKENHSLIASFFTTEEEGKQEWVFDMMLKKHYSSGTTKNCKVIG